MKTVLGEIPLVMSLMIRNALNGDELSNNRVN